MLKGFKCKIMIHSVGFRLRVSFGYAYLFHGLSLVNSATLRVILDLLP